MSLIDHARRELTLIGETPESIDGYLKVIEAFRSAGFSHSGGVASATIPIINKLLLFKPLSPLTDDPEEWTHISEEKSGAKEGVWQSNRDAEAFSDDGGKNYYRLSEGSNGKWRPKHASVHKEIQ